MGGSGGLFPPGSLGSVCRIDGDCTVGECCESAKCFGTCMVPCQAEADCDVAMGCAHDYCLFRCSVDADCLQPGFVCTHNATLCELD